MEHPTVHILLATYNGEAYLGDFLGSLAAQTFCHWHLHVRDDGSRDGTPAMLADAARGDRRITLLDDDQGNLGATRNFGALLGAVDGAYYMFADQDDVWHPDKIERSLSLLKSEESVRGAHHPILVFTDLEVTDAVLKTLHPSEIHRQGFDRLIAAGLTPRGLITQNVAAGCTMIFNRPLRDVAIPIPPEAAVHDWWLMLVAATVGTIAYLDHPTLFYRQHGGNQIGAAKPIERVWQVLHSGVGPYRKRQLQARVQAARLLERLGERLDPVDRAPCAVFANLDNYPAPLRQLRAARCGLKKFGWLRNLAFYILM